VRIGALVLRGFAARDRDAIAGALTGELAKRVSVSGVLRAFAGSQSAERLPAGSFPVRAGERGGRIGVAVARAVTAALHRERTR
jgi:hypothetical protein